MPGRGSGLVRAALFAVALAFVVALDLAPISKGDFRTEFEVGGRVRGGAAIPVEFTFTEARDNESSPTGGCRRWSRAGSTPAWATEG